MAYFAVSTAETGNRNTVTHTVAFTYFMIESISGTGLMILSRFPIERHETLSFENQFKAEQFGVNRGALYARITLPDTTNTKGRNKGRSSGSGRALPGGLDLVTCHTTASMAEALLKVKRRCTC
jgi:hypothetical protein